MEISSKQILKLLNILSWIIFVGLCVQAGGFIFNSLYILVYNPIGAHNYWNGLDFSGLYQFDKGYFGVMTLLMTIVAVMKAVLFYLIVKILHGEKLNMAQPFKKEVGSFIFRLSYLALGIGVFSSWGVNYSEWLAKQNVAMPNVEFLHIGGADVWLFMAVILFVIGHIFKRGIEIQTENELTV